MTKPRVSACENLPKANLRPRELRPRELRPRELRPRELRAGMQSTQPGDLVIVLHELAMGGSTDLLSNSKSKVTN